MGIEAAAREDGISHFPVRLGDIRLEYAIPFPIQRDSSAVSGGIAPFLSIESVVESLATSLPS